MSELRLDQHPTLLLGALRRLRRKVEDFNMKGRLSGKEVSRQWGGDWLTWFLNQVLWSPTFCLLTGLCPVVSSVTVSCLWER